MSQFRTLDDLKVTGKRVLVRADLNVPMQDGVVSDATRITRFAPTAQKLAAAGARVVILSHFGRPEGVANPAFSLAPLVAELAKATLRPVSFAPDCVGPVAEAAVAALQDGEVLLLENVRFHAGEEANDAGFTAALAKLGDLYVNDAFSVSHRAHASTTQLAKLLPAAAGLLMAEELAALEAALGAPQRPVVALVGGAKISTKLALLENLITKVDVLVIGGAMANTFLAAQGFAMGRSLTEPALYETAREILKKAEALGKRIVLPVDMTIAPAIDAKHGTAVALTAIPADQMALDIGPNTIAEIDAELAKAKTVVWNGPLGAFEHKPFDLGTVAVGVAVAKRTLAGQLVSIAGGGDTVAALEVADLTDKLTYVSAAGGAFLEWLEGKELPGVAALAV